MYKPALYTTANELQRRDANDFAEEYGDEIAQMSGSCLDIGSGPGDVMVDLILPKMDPKARIVCSDISEPMLNFGRERYRDNERLSFIKLNIESLDLPQNLVGQFDHVTSLHCLHWCRDMPQVFKNIFNLLKPGGSTLLLFMANNPGFGAYEVLANMPRYQPYMKDVDRYIPVFQHAEKQRETLKTLVRNEGFEVLHCSLRERSYTFKSPDILAKCMLAVNPFVERMPVELREDYKKDLVAEVTKLKIILNNSDIHESKYSILSRYYVFMVHLKKP